MKAQSITVDANADTFLSYHYQLDSSAPHGAESTMYVIGSGPGAEAFPLVGFDLQSYAGRSVAGSSATVRLYVIDAYPYKNPTQSIEAHESLVAWNEASVKYADFGNSFGIQPTEIGPALTTSIVSWDALPRYVTWSIPASVVQSWIDSPSSNNGLLFMSTTGALWQDLQFASREDSLAAPPQLEFDLSLPWQNQVNHLDVNDDQLV